MDSKRISELVSNSNRIVKRLDKTVLTAIDKALKEKPYRADLVVTSAKQRGDNVVLNIRYHTEFPYPHEHDLMAVVAESHSGYEIDWDSVLVDPTTGTVVLSLEPAVESIPLGSISDIPNEFVSIGSALYKRAADASGDVQEVWELKRTDEGLALIRNKDDMEITAEEKEDIVAGSLVDTPYGPGKVLRFDEAGNAFVQVGSAGGYRTRLVAKESVKPYNRDKDKKALQDFYSQLYGPEFAKGLVNDYGRK